MDRLRDRIFQIAKLYLMGKVQGVSLLSRKTRIASKTLIRKPKSTIWKNRLTKWFTNSTTSRQRRLQLWREKGRIQSEKVQ